MLNKRFMNRAIGTLIVLSMSAAILSAQQPAARKPALSPDVKSSLDRISAASMQGHLSFIASDLLEGRNTPSVGLDVAANYIAAQMRRAGLEAAGDDGYFQTARWLLAERDMDKFELKIQSGGETIEVAKDRVSLPSSGVLDLTSAPVFKIDYKQLAANSSIPPELIAGRVIFTEIPDFRRAYDEDGMKVEEFDEYGATIRTLRGFISSSHDLMAELRDFMLPNPDVRKEETVKA